jgi:hypothetical protein
VLGEAVGGKFGFNMESEDGHAIGYEIENFFGFTGTGVNSLGAEVRTGP